jgi:acyl transferase domain-containing protein
MSRPTDIAVIGVACRFPDARNPGEYWQNLWQGRVSIREIPAARWKWQESLDDTQEEEEQNRCKWGSFIEDVDCFDRAFFGLSAREAKTMDPQQRLSLELAWTCFESAGIRPAMLSRRPVGVFIGAANLDYKEIVESGQDGINAHYASGIGASVIANRLSYYFDFVGPSVTFDTACSSSLFAIHAACQSLRSEESTLALAGGVSCLLTFRRFVCFSRAGMLSPTGAIRSFDNAADGMVRGEGGGLILLKPLLAAESDGDTILGVIKGSAINHSGRTYSLTYPSSQMQASVIVEARKAGGVSAADVTYLEAHGTGTPKGDPIELEGIKLANASLDNDSGSHEGTISYCGLGSAKANIGHLEAAAGIAGVIKVVLALRHKALPPLAGFNSLNTRINLADSGLVIIDKAQDWPLASTGAPLTAGISSFGFAGTNAHVVLQAAPERAAHQVEQLPAHILCLAAKTPEALTRKQQEMLEWLNNHDEPWTAYEVCEVLLHGREHFGVRCAVIGTNKEELISHLEDGLNERSNPFFFAGEVSQEDQEGDVDRHANSGDMRDLRSMDATSAMDYLGILAGRYVNGENPAQWGVYSNRSDIAMLLPTYPFEKTRCWVEPDESELQESRHEPLSERHSPAPQEKPNNIKLTPLDAFAKPEDHEAQPSTCEGVPGNTPANPSLEIDGLLERIYAGSMDVDDAVEALSGLVVSVA